MMAKRKKGLPPGLAKFMANKNKGGASASAKARRRKRGKR
jgi:hypothetical protein